MLLLLSYLDFLRKIYTPNDGGRQRYDFMKKNNVFNEKLSFFLKERFDYFCKKTNVHSNGTVVHIGVWPFKKTKCRFQAGLKCRRA